LTRDAGWNVFSLGKPQTEGEREMLTEQEKNLAQRHTVADIFRRNARHAPDKVAIVEKRGEEEVRLTDRELNERINPFAAGLQSLGYEKGDRVAILGLNSYEFIITVFGCARGGFVAVPLNPGMGPRISSMRSIIPGPRPWWRTTSSRPTSTR
jgi:acyl-CoA synthetase (AMP-forming)/AMP-acid ligase II